MDRKSKGNNTRFLQVEVGVFGVGVGVGGGNYFMYINNETEGKLSKTCVPLSNQAVRQ